MERVNRKITRHKYINHKPGAILCLVITLCLCFSHYANSFQGKKQWFPFGSDHWKVKKNQSNSLFMIGFQLPQQQHYVIDVISTVDLSLKLVLFYEIQCRYNFIYQSWSLVRNNNIISDTLRLDGQRKVRPELQQNSIVS